MTFFFFYTYGYDLNLHVLTRSVPTRRSSDLEQKAGRSKLDAIMTASGIRLRPILMPTAAMVLSVVPLVIATGAGAVGRNHMGLVIFTGISIGTLFTLFVVPAMYLWLAADHKEIGRAHV